MRIIPKLFSFCILLTFLATIAYRFYPHPPAKPYLQATRFSALPEWTHLKHAKSLQVFQASCQKKQSKICLAAMQVKATDDQAAKRFFEQHFIPKYWVNTPKPRLTGYYAPSIEGRLQPDAEFRYPIYGMPDDLVILNLRDFSPNFPNKRLYGKILNQRFVPYDDRASIYQGRLKNRAPVIAWVKSLVDGLELEIQGSGIILTPERRIILNYAAQNGHPYHAIGRFLVQEGKMAKEDVTFGHIRTYFAEHPDQIQHFLQQNPSYVFFKVVPKFAFYGYQNLPLNPGYSIAVDPAYIPMGTPVFVSTTLPHHHALQRLLIAQDIGGAIKGPTRGDIYWGTEAKAKQLAGDMNQIGQIWLLIPKIDND